MTDLHWRDGSAVIFGTAIPMSERLWVCTSSSPIFAVYEM